MKKGIIVMNVPKIDCRECQAFGSYNTCGVLQRFIDPIIGKIPDWCPIHEMPEKKDSSNFSLQNTEYEQGWNDCLNAIDPEN